MKHVEVAKMKAILTLSEARKISPWIIGVTTVFLGIFLIGLAVDNRTWLGYCAAACVVLTGVVIVGKWFLKSE
jgi:hypothetical protein